MAKLYFKLPFNLIAVIAVLVFSSEVFATKMARTQLLDLLNSADIVAVVMIENSRLTNETQAQIHASTQLPLIEHRSRVIDGIKNVIDEAMISFLNTRGLSVGSKYIVFLTKSDKKTTLG